jgi:hypothetical protein
MCMVPKIEGGGGGGIKFLGCMFVKEKQLF